VVWQQAHKNQKKPAAKPVPSRDATMSSTTKEGATLYSFYSATVLSFVIVFGYSGLIS